MSLELRAVLRQRHRLRRRELCCAILFGVTLATAGLAQSSGDVNCDGRLDNEDLTVLTTQLFRDASTNCPAADVNADGAVNGADVVQLMALLAEPTPIPAGPAVTFIGLAGANGVVVNPVGTMHGAPVFFRNSGFGFQLVVEGRTGTSGQFPGVLVYNSDRNDPTRRPDIQMETNRALGDGSRAVCDGGVPAVNPPDFGPSQTVANALNDLACNFTATTAPGSGCTLDAFGQLHFVGPGTQVQFCLPVPKSLEFAADDTVLTVRLRDVAGNLGAAQQLILRVGVGPAPPTFTASPTPTVTRPPTRSATPTASPRASATSTRTPTSSPTPRTPTNVPTPQATASPTASATGTTTATRTHTAPHTTPASPTPSATRTPTLAATPATFSPTVTCTVSASVTATRTPSAPRTATATPTVTRSPTRTSTGATPPSATTSPTRTQTRTVTGTPTRSATPTRTPTLLVSATPTRTPTGTRTPSRTPTTTATPTPTLAGVVGPIITFFGVTRADDTLIDSDGPNPDGIPVYSRIAGSSFSLVIEGAPNPLTGQPVGPSSYNSDGDSFPDLQIEVSRALGNGTTAVCDRSSPAGGVPAVNPVDFSPTQTNIDAVNDLACRFRDGGDAPVGRGSGDSCIMFPSGDFKFMSRQSTIQFCGFIDRPLSFPMGDTTVTARLQDTDGKPGPPAQIVIHVLVDN